MTSLDWRSRLLAVALSALAGFVDALGFIELGGFFVSFMSGNTTRLGVGMAGAASDALLAAGLIAAFVVGVTGAVLLGRTQGARRARAVLLLTAAGLAWGAWLDRQVGGLPAGLALAFAMGATNATFSREGAAPIGVTYMTGALVRLGQHLADALSGHASPGWRTQAALWAGMAAGAAAGALAHPVFGLASLWIASLIAAALALTAPPLAPRS